MKKAEAISILATSVRPREAKDRARYDEAVKMAIEALKCSETPKSSERTSETAQADHTADISKKVCVDTISRQAAIDALDCINGAEEVLRALPSVQPERKNGRWVAVGERYVKCSKCGLETTKNELRGIALFGKNEPYFCPNCGADMRGEQDEAD